MSFDLNNNIICITEVTVQVLKKFSYKNGYDGQGSDKHIRSRYSIVYSEALSVTR